MSSIYHLMVAGSRDFSQYSIMEKFLDHIFSFIEIDKEIVEGGARGADTYARRYAENKGMPYHEFPAQWSNLGKRAGYVRNREMVSYIAKFDHRCIVCFWDGQSRGTAQNFDLAEEFSVDLIIVYYRTGNIEIRKRGKIS